MVKFHKENILTPSQMHRQYTLLVGAGEQILLLETKQIK